MRQVIAALAFVVFSLSASVVSADADPAAKCTSSKLKSTGKKAFGLVKAFGKNLKKPDAGKLSAAISKAESKFTKAFAKAEDTADGSCPTNNDSGAIEATVNTFVLDVIHALGSPSGAFVDRHSTPID